MAPEEEERQLVDQYRHIKRPLIAHAFGKRATKIEDGHLKLPTRPGLGSDLIESELLKHPPGQYPGAR